MKAEKTREATKGMKGKEKKAAKVMRAFVLMLCAGMLLITGCRPMGKSSEPSSSETPLSQDAWVPKETQGSETDIQKVIAAFESRQSSLNSEEIVRIEVDFVTPTSTTAYVTEDKEFIDRWVSLFRKIRVSARPFEPVCGVGYNYSYYTEDGVRHQLFSGFLPSIYVDNTVSLRSDNAEEWISELVELEMAIGIPYSVED